MKKRVVAIFTGNRAEYGLQVPILRAVSEHPALEYRLIVSGAHLDKNFGRTLDEIQNDGFTISHEVQIDVSGDDLTATAHAIGTGVLSISETLAEIKPDIMVVYADRFEAFAAAIAASQMSIPLAHIEGGDLTEGGALDDSVRHAMTKLAHLHFTTNELASKRIRQMGEEPWRVHTVGYPAIDLISRGLFTSPEDVAKRYSLDLTRPILVFTQHSVATQFDEAAAQAIPALRALKILALSGIQVIITYPNNDAGGRAIIAEIQKMGTVPNIQVHPSLGRANFHGLLNVCGRAGTAGGACVGNSSSVIKETPAFGCPSVLIGSRQDSRLASTNVIRTGYDETEIGAGIRRALTDQKFIAECHGCENPYGIGDAGIKIAEILSTIELGPRMITKKMITLAVE